MNLLLQRLFRARPGQLLRLLLPTTIDHLVYAHTLGPTPGSRPYSRLPIRIEKKAVPGGWSYVALFNDQAVHRTLVRNDVLLLRQFGIEPAPVIGYSETQPLYRGQGIYQCVLSFIIDDFARTKISKVIYIMVYPHNTVSIKGIEKTHFSLVAHLKGIRLGPFVFGRSRELR